MAEGLKLVIDALDLGWSIRTLVFAKSALGNAAVEKVAARTVAAGGDVLEVTEKILTAITRRDNPQTVVGVFEQRFMPLEDIQAGRTATSGWRSTGCAIPAISARSSAPSTRSAPGA